MVWVWWDLKDRLLPTALQIPRTPPIHRVVQGPIQPGFEHSPRSVVLNSFFFPFLKNKGYVSPFLVRGKFTGQPPLDRHNFLNIMYIGFPTSSTSGPTDGCHQVSWTCAPSGSLGSLKTHLLQTVGSSSFCQSCWFLLCITSEFGGSDLSILTTYLRLLFPPGLSPMSLHRADPWLGQNLLCWSPGYWACCAPNPHPEDLKLHHFMVTAAQAALEIHVPHQIQ